MRRPMMKLAAACTVMALAAGACGSDKDKSSDTTAAAATPTTAAGTATTAAGSETTEAGSETTTAGSVTADTTDFGGAKVLITGSERDDPSVAAINGTLQAWGETRGLDITFAGDADWETNINTQVQGGNAPDIGIFPQPGKLADFARAGSIKPLADNVLASLAEYWSTDYSDYAKVDGVQYGVPVKTDLKSLVWYQPQAFKDAGYEVPTTFDEFTALVAKMTADGGPKALCVGIESGGATGWTFTDWVEEMILRQDGGDFYDQWVAHEVPFNDPKVVTAIQTVLDLWSDDNVYADGGNIAATAFQANGPALAAGKCFMHRQASFFSGFFPEGTKFADGSPGAVDVFYFPDINGDKPVLTAGTYAAAFNDNPATMAVLEYLSTADYAQKRQAAQTEFLKGGLSGFLSAAKGQDPSVYQPLEQGFLDILNNSELSRFDASDLMPADVGAGTFWTDGTSAVNGDISAEEAADDIEASWPSDTGGGTDTTEAGSETTTGS
jgi:alpha-glucoside transport system substrate-binding protein